MSFSKSDEKPVISEEEETDLSTDEVFLDPAHTGPEHLETPARKKKRLRSIYLIHFAMFAVSLGYFVMIIGTLPYLKRLLPNNDDEDDIMLKYSLITAAQPAGQMMFMAFFGWLANKVGSIRVISIALSILFIVANTIAAILSVFQEKNRFWLFFLARFLSGVASSVKAPWRSYMTQITYTSERTVHLAILGGGQTLGIVIGPLIQSGLTAVGCVDNLMEERYISLDTYTLANWFAVVLGILSALAFLPGLFKEYDVNHEEKAYLVDQVKKRDSDDSPEDLSVLKPDYFVVFIIMFSNFFYIFNFAVVETLSTPICFDQFGWNEADTLLFLGISMAVGGVLSICSIFSLKKLLPRYDERNIMIWGIFFLFFSKVIMFPLPGADHPPLRPVDDNDTRAMHLSDSWMDALSNPGSWSELLGSSAPLDRAAHDPCDSSSADGDGGSYCDYDWCETQPAMSEWQFFLGYLVTFAAFPYVTTISMSIFTKVLGPRPQGIWVGLLSTFSSLSRVASPIIITLLYTSSGNYISMGVISGMCVMALILNFVFYRRLIPMKKRVENERLRRLEDEKAGEVSEVSEVADLGEVFEEEKIKY